MFIPFQPSPSLAQTAQAYVARNGSDSNNGTSWSNAFATVQHAVNSLPVNNGVQSGVVQLGYGQFSYSSPLVIAASNGGIVINGLASGEFYDAANNQVNPVYVSELHYTGTSDAVQITGAPTFGGPSGPVTNTGVTFSNLAITSTGVDRYGLNVTNTEGIRLVNVNIDNHGVFGIRQSKVFGLLLNNSYITRCGNASSSTPTGGHFLDTALGPNPGTTYLQSQCAFNDGFGLYDAGSPSTSTGLSATQSIFSNNVASAMAGSGCGIFSAGQGQFTGCDFEANSLYGASLGAGGQFSFTGCDFLGDGVSAAGIYNGAGGGSIPVVIGCRFSGHTGGYSIVNTSTAFLSWAACVSTDSTGFINNGAAVGVVPADGFAPAVTGATGAVITGYSPQTINSNQAVTCNASWGFNVFILNANVTATTCPVGPPGQPLNLGYVQGSGAPHTYVWPSTCRFSGGVTPTPSTVAGRADMQQFISNGVVWMQYPGINVPNA